MTNQTNYLPCLKQIHYPEPAKKMYIFLINIGEVEIFESISPIFNANMLYGYD